MVYCQWRRRQSSARERCTHFSCQSLKERPWFHDINPKNCLSAMHGFRDNEVLLQAEYDVITSPPPWYDVIVIFPPGAIHANFHDGFWKRVFDFLIAFHSNFLSAMHGFQANEVLLPSGYDVIVRPAPGGAARYSHNGFWKSDHDFLIAFHSNAWFPTFYFGW